MNFCAISFDKLGPLLPVCVCNILAGNNNLNFTSNWLLFFYTVCVALVSVFYSVFCPPQIAFSRLFVCGTLLRVRKCTYENIFWKSLDLFSNDIRCGRKSAPNFNTACTGLVVTTVLLDTSGKRVGALSLGFLNTKELFAWRRRESPPSPPIIIYYRVRAFFR
jgi:hypothetical protein